ncbi:hypothetical protein JT358_05635, partial [Micrococcales bacterium 31B]|nr:hypothetical protein [Micrococcales bacterium 31B]
MRFYRQHYWRAVAIAAAASMGVTGVGLAPASAAVAGGLAPLAADAAQAVLSITSPATDTTVFAPDGQLTVTGTVAAGEEVDVTGPDGTAVKATVTAGADGEPSTWSATVAATPGAAQTFTVQAFTPEVAGGAARTASGDPMTTTVDVLAEVPAPVITAPDVSAVVAGGAVDISGTAPANSTVTLTVNGTALAPVTADGDGAWTVTGVTTVAGQNTATATAAVGANVSAASAETTFTVNPTAPEITTPAAGALPAGTATTTISGSATAGASVVVTVNGTALPAVIADDQGAWSVADAEVRPGANEVTATQTVNGATSASSAATNFTVPLEAPTITTPISGSVHVVGGDLTVSGTAPTGATGVVLTLDTGDPLTVAATDGAWSTTLSGVEVGEHTLSATSTGPNGATSTAVTASITAIPRTGTPVITAPDVSAIVAGGAVDISGTAPANSTVTLTVNDTALAPVTADGDGAWTVTGVTTVAGENTATATAAVGTNVSAASAETTFTVNPTAPEITTPAAGALPAGTATTTISGSATAGASVVVTVNGTALPAVIADDQGAWSLADAAVQPGANEVTATQTVNGATSASSAATNFTVTVAAPVISVPAEGAALEPGDATTITGTALPGAVVSVTVNGGEAQTTEA